MRPPETPGARVFPFERFSTNQIDALKKWLPIQYPDLPYQPRFLPPRQDSFEAELDTRLLVLTGRAGLGKTRECIELFRRLAERKGEEITILYPRPDFDRPNDDAIPPNFAPKHLILFVDEIERRSVCPRREASSSDAPIRTFHDRLFATIEWLREQFAGRDWRVVLTAADEPAGVDEPELRDRLRLENAAQWPGFKIFQLPGIHRDARPAFIRTVANHPNLEIQSEAVEYAAAASDGTCSGITTALASECLGRSGQAGKLTLETVRKYQFRYPVDWETRVYPHMIAPFPYRRCVFEALSGLSQLRIPSDLFIVVDLAARLCRRGWFSRLQKKLIERAIREDLRAWMFEYRGTLICPTAYTRGRLDTSQILPQIMKCLKQTTQRKERLPNLLPALVAVSFRLCFDLGRPNEALTLLRMCAKQAPDYAPAFTAESLVLAHLGKNGESLRAAEAAANANSESSEALVVLAYAQTRVGYHDRAIATACRATMLAPSNDFVWLNLGVVLRKRRLYVEARDALQKACDLNPQSAKARYSLGVVYDRLGRRQDAVDACERATKLDPFDSEAWHTLGICYDRSGESEQALGALGKARQLDDTNPAICLSLGRALFTAGMTSDGLLALQDSVSRTASDPDQLNRISVAYGDNAWFEKAVEVASSALKIEPKHVDAWRSLAMNLANISGREEDAKKARAQLKTLCQSADDWCGLSILFGRAGEYEQAAAAARRAIDIEPKHVDAWRSLAMNLANISGREEDAKKARAQLETLCQSADDWCGLSILFGRAGEYEQAAAAARRAIDIEPKHVDAWHSLAMNLDQLRRSAEAVVAWQRVRDLTGDTIDTSRALAQVESNPGSEENWKCLAEVYRAANRPREAISVARSEVARAPKIAPATIPLVEELLNSEPEEIARFLRALLLLDPGNAQYIHLRGAANLKAGHVTDAIKDLQAACDLAPKQKNYWYALGKAFENGNRYSDARTAYEKATQLKHAKAGAALKRLAEKLALQMSSIESSKPS